MNGLFTFRLFKLGYRALVRYVLHHQILIINELFVKPLSNIGNTVLSPNTRLQLPGRCPEHWPIVFPIRKTAAAYSLTSVAEGSMMSLKAEGLIDANSKELRLKDLGELWKCLTEAEIREGEVGIYTFGFEVVSLGEGLLRYDSKSNMVNCWPAWSGYWKSPHSK